MITVPAHSFCEPTRAKFTAAARNMPGVWGVLLSSRSLLMTRTPSLRQSRSDFNLSLQEVITGAHSCATRPQNNRIHELYHPNYAARPIGRAALLDHSRAAHFGDLDGRSQF